MIEVRELSKECIDKIYSLNGYFTIDSYLDISLNNNKFTYDVIPCETREKRYDDEGDEVDFESFIGNKNKVVFLAFYEGQYAGRIILTKAWNNYVHIEDITVDKKYRGSGIAKELMDKAREWALECGVKGLSLETQNINVRACKFYEKYGFILGGFNNKLYKALNNDEIALFWYYMFE